MKFKTYILAILVIIASNSISAQTGNPAARFQATMTQSSPNSVMVAFRSNISFSGQFSNLQFTFQVPSSVAPVPTVSIKSNPLSAFVPTAGYTVVTTPEPGFTTYSYNVVVTGAPVFSFVGGTAYNALEISFNNGTMNTTNVRLAHLADGGITLQEAFYVEINGNDNTDYASMFYGPGAVNGGNYSAYSYFSLANIALPVKFTAFDLIKKDNDAYITWAVENETSITDRYEVERSLEGLTFEKIITLPKANNGASGNVYASFDRNISKIKSNGLIYYRIKQIDANGQFVYSEIKNVRVTEKYKSITAYPNPVKDVSTIEIDSPLQQDIVLNVFNADGKMLQTLTMKAIRGINIKKINMATYAAGNYLLNIIMGDEVQTIKIIKE